MGDSEFGPGDRRNTAKSALSADTVATLLAAGALSREDVERLAAERWRADGVGAFAGPVPAKLSRRATTALRRFADAPRELRQGRLAEVRDFMQRADVFCIDATSPVYPPMLRHVEDAPGVLMVRGHLEAVVAPGIAIVGSREATPGAVRFAQNLGAALAGIGIPVVSGLARGIDTAALRGAHQGGGRTVAVMGRGLAATYPASNLPLADALLGRGAWVSEFAPSVGPRAHHFPQRNRVISGLSRAVVVVEAAVRSGSLITARFALEQNREVLAVPGSVWNPQSAGCHQLIHDGAALADSVERVCQDARRLFDVLDSDGQPVCRETPPVGAPVPNSVPSPSTEDGGRLLAAVGFEPATLEELLARTRWPVVRLRSALVTLELEGFVRPERGGYIRVPGDGRNTHPRPEDPRSG